MKKTTALYGLFASLAITLALTPQRADAEKVVLGAAFLTVQLTGLGFCAYAARHPRLTAEERRPWPWLTG